MADSPFSRPLVLLASVVGVILIAAPASIIVTILLLPIWSGLEAATGLECVGHSGPAEWCYVTAFLVIATAGTLRLVLRHVGRSQSRTTPPALATAPGADDVRQP